MQPVRPGNPFEDVPGQAPHGGFKAGRGRAASAAGAGAGGAASEPQVLQAKRARSLAPAAEAGISRSAARNFTDCQGDPIT